MHSITASAGYFVTNKIVNQHFKGKYRKNKRSLLDPSSYTAGNEVVLNVSGSKFRLHESYLQQFPETLLGSNKRNFYYDMKNREYFFDRDPYIFRFIHNYYKTGKLHYSSLECYEAFTDELNFFLISNDEIADCCFECPPHVSSQDKSQLIEYKQPIEEFQSATVTFRQSCWNFANYPAFSCPAKIFYYIICCAILLSIVVNTVETIHCGKEKLGNATMPIRCGDVYHDVFFIIDSVCVTFFTLEFLLRFYGAPNRFQFIRSFMAIIDVLAILPYFLDLLLNIFDAGDVELIKSLVVLRALRIIRVFKLVRHSSRLQDLTKSILNSASELGFILFMYFIVVIIFASIIFYAENVGHHKTKFVSIPEAIWYTVVTTTTLGYGDIVPATIQGKLIGSVCCLMGVLVIALPVPIIQMKSSNIRSKSL